MRLGKIIAIAASMAATPCMAWDGQVTGAITKIDASPADGNLGFRVRLAGEPAMCGSSSLPWAYISKSMPNYDASVALIISAYAMGKSVTVYSNIVSGYCEIGYITVGS